MADGCIHVYTGSGKGKTTAALGSALRAAGAGMRVFFAQFIKQRRTSEEEALARFPGEIILKRYETGFLRGGAPKEKDLFTMREALKEVRGVLAAGTAELVVLDEILVAVNCGLIKEEEVLELMREKPRPVELVLTGRGATERIIATADLVTEMREVRHYFSSGVKARKGIEY